MKFLVLLFCILGLSLNAQMPGYILNKETNKQAQQENITQESFTDLLKHNFQMLTENTQFKDLIKKYGKGNLLAPVQLNYMFLIEGMQQELLEGQKINLNISDNEKLLDEIFGINNKQQENNLINLAKQFFPAQKRAPFYYYKSSSIINTNNIEKSFGIELKRDPATNTVFLFDTLANKRLTKNFKINQFFAKAFPNFALTKDAIVSASTGAKLEINEENVQDVENLLRDVCAVSQLSTLFKKSDFPNFIVFALNNKGLENNELVNELVAELIKNTQANLENTLGEERVFGQALFLDNILDISSERQAMQPRILAETHKEADPEPQTNNDTVKQIKAWFSIAFGLILLFTIAGLFNAEQARDSLLYAKFSITDGR